MASTLTVDGNEAAARVAHSLSEVIAIYPITPASPMGELSDAWSTAGRTNVWGQVPLVVEMQSEGGAAGALHGALQGGALATTFTASQGLLLMIPDMYKIAGELTPAVIHVAARTVATHALSIFGDHSDVMAARTTGFAMLASASVQEAQDLAAVAHAATLSTRVPFLHFFDGFRTSHEISKIVEIARDDLVALIDQQAVDAHRLRALEPERPVIRGTAQNPDVFFQAREAINPFYVSVAATVQAKMSELEARSGRSYHLFDYVGSPTAEEVIVMMGSGIGAAEEAVEALVAEGRQVGLVKVRMYRPFDVAAFTAALPETVSHVAVLDRTKEPGAVGEPLFQDVVAALAESGRSAVRVIGGRYGLSSKEFTPPMAIQVLAEAGAANPQRHFTVGIVDDVSGTSLDLPVGSWAQPKGVFEAVFYGLGADGTVGANKNTVKIVGESTELYGQGYFVYDSKKSGSTTVSHLRFGERPITSTYLVEEADFVACHQFGLLSRMDVLERAAHGSVLLLNSPHEDTWAHLPPSAQKAILDKELTVYVVDAHAVARDAGLGGRINTVLQTCFFALTDLVPREQAIIAIKEAIRKTYGRLGEPVLRRNHAAVDAALSALHPLVVPPDAGEIDMPLLSVPEIADDFVARVTRTILAGHGDRLPVSALPIDGTFPTGTARIEKRSIGTEIPIWDADICIDCGRCALVCPHAAIRMKVFDPSDVEGAPDGFVTKEWSGKEFPGSLLAIQVAPDDCTGCAVCVNICPAKSKEMVRHKAINMEPKANHLDVERQNFSFFLDIPEVDRTTVAAGTVKGSQVLQPLFEFSGACAGCGETPYLKLLTQLFGDRVVVANATGCSSIYGGNLPTTPWSSNGQGRGPAWSNSLFEDNAEFGLGIRLAVDQKRARARALVAELAPVLGDDLASALLDADQSTEAGLAEQRERVARAAGLLETSNGAAAQLAALLDALVEKSVWIVGGDGWAYDIGFGGLDHVLASGRNVNVLVLDTEVYSNTGGQASKATPRAAVAKFASGGKPTRKKDLGMIASAYGNVYVAQIAMGANMTQTVKAFVEAESFDGPSLIIAYSPCIAHGIDMSQMMGRQKLAMTSGYWPLYRFDPRLAASEHHPFQLDSRAPTTPFSEFAAAEARYAILSRTDRERFDELQEAAQQDIDERWRLYEQLAGIERGLPGEEIHP